MPNPTLSQVSGWNATYRTQCPPTESLPCSFLITANDLAELQAAYTAGTLDGVRGYHGIDGQGKRVWTIVGTKKNAQGIHEDVNITELRAGRPCPTYCPPSNALNS